MQYKLLKPLCISLLFVIFDIGKIAHASLMLQVENGILTGATDVEVNGSLFDVNFLDGTCPQLYSGCDASEDFIFNTSDSARQASLALLTQVFVDGQDGLFDSQGGLISGCSFAPVCVVKTVFERSNNLINMQTVQNRAAGGAADTLGVDSTLFNLGTSSGSTFAVWSKASSVTPIQVNEPVSASLLMLGLFGLSIRHRKKAANRGLFLRA